MIKLLKEAWQILRNNTIFTQPIWVLLFFLLLAMPYLSLANTNLIARTTLSISVFLFICAFLSGWFHIYKLGIEAYNPSEDLEETNRKSLENFKKFFSGIGENFLKCLISYIILGIIWVLIYIGITKFCLQHYGSIEFINEKLIEDIKDIQNIKNVLTIEQINTINKWTLTIFPISLTVIYCFVVYNASLFFDNKNIFITIFNTIKFLFKNFFFNIGLIALLFLIFTFFGTIIPSFGANLLTVFIYMIFITAYINYYVIIVFRLYSERTKTNSNNGAEFSRQDSDSNSVI